MILLPYYLWKARRQAAKSQEELREHSLERLKRTVEHAHDTVPFYRRTWDREGFSPGDLQTLDDITRIPVIDKEDVLENWDDFVSSEASDHGNRGDFLRERTAGTTDDPLDVLKGKETYAYNWAVEQRAAGFYGAGVRDSQTVFKDRADIEKSRGVFGNRLLHRLFGDHHVPLDSPWPEQKQTIEETDPSILMIKPAVLTYLLYDMPDIDPDIIVTEGEVSDRPTRERAEERLGAPVHDLYGSKEFGLTGWSCPEDPSHYHVSTDHVILESVDDGEPVTGEYGTAVGTALTNHAFPLIRFNLGDLIKLSGDADCGSPFPAIEGIRGKKDRYVESGGERYYSRDVKDAVLSVEGVQRFRIRGEEGKTVELDIAPDYESGDVVETVVERLEELLGTGVDAEPRELSLDEYYKNELPQH